MRSLIISSALVLAGGLAITACTADPAERGTLLGAAHAEALSAETITYPELRASLEEAEAEFETQQAKAVFETAYRKQLRGHEAEVAELAAEASVDALTATGRALVSGAGELLADIAEDVEEGARNLGKKENKEKAKEAGRKIGRVLHGIGEALEATAEGIAEGFEEARESGD